MADVRTAGLVWHLAAASVRALSGSRRMTMLRLAGAGTLVASEAAGAVILLERFGGIGGWTTAEVLILFGLAEIGLGLGLAMAEPLEPANFSQLLRDGRFDQALTRPVSPWLWTVAADVQIRHLGRAGVGVVLVAGAAVGAGVDPTPGHLLLLTVSGVAMGVVVTAVLTIGAAFTMFTVEGTEIVNSFTYGGASVAGWPLQIYDSALRAVFVWAIPIGATVYLPVLWVLDRSGPAGAGRELLPGVPLLVAVFCLAAAGAWRIGLRHHTGVGA